MKGVREGNRTLLAKAITLIESNAEKHFLPAQELIKELSALFRKFHSHWHNGSSSEQEKHFIENFGLYLIEQGHKVAVLAIDPQFHYQQRQYF